MLASRAGRGIFRQLPTSTSVPRVDKLTSKLLPSSLAYSTVNSFNLALRPRCIPGDSSGSRRGLATRQASKPKAHTGRTTRTTRASKPKTTTAGGKKATKPKATKAKPRSKPVKKRKVKAKAKAKPRTKRTTKTKKAQTEEQKAKAAEKERNTTIRELKAAALKTPRGLPETAWLVINTEHAKTIKGADAKGAAEKYKNLVPEELEHYNHLANENRTKNRLAHETWLQSLTPDQVRVANNARALLKRMGVRSQGKCRPLVDDRRPKRPAHAHALFLKARFATGDMRGMKVTDAMKIITREWKELDASEKQPYFDMQRKSRERYAREWMEAYGRAPGRLRKGPTKPKKVANAE